MKGGGGKYTRERAWLVRGPTEQGTLWTNRIFNMIRARSAKPGQKNEACADGAGEASLRFMVKLFRDDRKRTHQRFEGEK